MRKTLFFLLQKRDFHKHAIISWNLSEYYKFVRWTHGKLLRLWKKLGVKVFIFTFDILSAWF